MKVRRLNKFALMCAASVVALTSGAQAQETETVTVTGSRLISDISLSPTPITAVSAEQLQATTPTNIPDALNKLPVFVGAGITAGSDPLREWAETEQKASIWTGTDTAREQAG